MQLLIEPKPREPTKHQYDYDAQTVISFLKTYGLDKHFKLNIEPNHTTLAGHSYEHDLLVASKYGFLGSIDANTGDELVRLNRPFVACTWRVQEQHATH